MLELLEGKRATVEWCLRSSMWYLELSEHNVSGDDYIGTKQHTLCTPTMQNAVRIPQRVQRA